MILEKNAVHLETDDYKELFSIFSSPTDFEIGQIYDPANNHYFKNVRLDDEYSLTQERQEFAIDAWRAVIVFMKRNGFSLLRQGEEINLSFIEEELY